MNTLPPVWLNTHVATNVNVNAPRSPVGGSMCAKTSGTCQRATSGARIMVDTSGERLACKPGRARPRQPGSSPIGPFRGLISFIANTMMMLVKGGKVASDGTGAPIATMSATATAAAASGMPKATAYQRHPTRQRIIRKPSSRSPAQPWVRSEEHTSELQSPDHLVCRLLLEKKKNTHYQAPPELAPYNVYIMGCK